MPKGWWPGWRRPRSITDSIRSAFIPALKVWQENTNEPHRLKRFQGLDGALEADRTWFEMVFVRCLSDDRANQVIGQDMCPQFLANQFGSLAPQHVHLHGLFEGLQIEFGIPPGAIQFRQFGRRISDVKADGARASDGLATAAAL